MLLIKPARKSYHACISITDKNSFKEKQYATPVKKHRTIY